MKTCVQCEDTWSMHFCSLGAGFLNTPREVSRELKMISGSDKAPPLLGVRGWALDQEQLRQWDWLMCFLMKSVQLNRSTDSRRSYLAWPVCVYSPELHGFIFWADFQGCMHVRDRGKGAEKIQAWSKALGGAESYILQRYILFYIGILYFIYFPP